MKSCGQKRLLVTGRLPTKTSVRLVTLLVLLWLQALHGKTDGLSITPRTVLDSDNRSDKLKNENTDDGAAIAPKFASRRYGKNEAIMVKVHATLALELKCKASGNPHPKITWFKDGVEISEATKRRFGGYKLRKWTLSVARTNSLDAGIYSCEVANENGKIKQDFSVKVGSKVVGHKPIIKNGQPGNRSVVAGEDIELKCEIELLDVADPPMIQWAHHQEIDGSFLDANGNPNTELLQDCSMSGHCSISESNQTYLVDDPQVFFFSFPISIINL